MYILICDDEPAVARQVEQLARQHLEQRGIPVQCTVCTRGEEVLARSDLAQYQLALLDVDLEAEMQPPMLLELRQMWDDVAPLTLEHVPADSLVREFAGDSVFLY